MHLAGSYQSNSYKDKGIPSSQVRATIMRSGTERLKRHSARLKDSKGAEASAGKIKQRAAPNAKGIISSKRVTRVKSVKCKISLMIECRNEGGQEQDPRHFFSKLCLSLNNEMQIRRKAKANTQIRMRRTD